MRSVRFSHNLTHNVANLEVKSKAPNGVAFTVKGKSDNKTGAINGQVYMHQLLVSFAWQISLSQLEFRATPLIACLFTILDRS